MHTRHCQFLVALGHNFPMISSLCQVASAGAGADESLDMVRKQIHEDDHFSEQCGPIHPSASAIRADGVVENRPAAGTLVGAASAASSPTSRIVPPSNTRAIAAINAQPLVDVQDALMQVEKSIEAVDAEIKIIHHELQPLVHDFVSPGAMYLRDKERHLRDEMKLLRDYERQLRDEKLLLMQDKQLQDQNLRISSRSAGSVVTNGMSSPTVLEPHRV
jgi:hypothetical protein